MTWNQGYSYRWQLDESVAGHSLLSYLVQRFTHSTEQEWSSRIQSAQVLIDGQRATETTELHPGLRITWDRPPWEEADTPQDIATRFEDEHVLVVSKPSGLPTLPGGGFYQNTLLSLVRQRHFEARPLHRLGRFTAGLVMFALHKTAARRLTHSWPQVIKKYRALSRGVAAEDFYDIQEPIGPIAHPRLQQVHAASSTGKPSRSLARLLRRNSDSSLFDVELCSGRPHQIRIHLACIGHPLLGDPMYEVGGGLQANPGLPGDGGYQLHAHRLIFEHPMTEQPLEITHPLPEHLK